MKLCDTCIYRNNVEQLKPCIIYRDDCEYYEKERGDMTNKQAKAEIMQIYGVLSPSKQQALDMAIKALEQQPCEDAIRRQAVLEQTYLWSKDEFLRVTNPFDYLRKRINDIPSVNPQEPKYCNRNICVSNEYNGIGCDECEVTKSHEPKVGE